MTAETPHLRRLVVRGFRGIESLDWYPAPGLNVLLGGGDVGKTTVLQAIGLLLQPTGSVNLSDADYWARDVEAGFMIEGTLSLPDYVEVSQLPRMVYPWSWDGKQACVPDPEDEGEAGEPIYVFRVRATPDFEVFHEIVDPNGHTDYLPVTLRRRIGLVWLGSDEPDRELRLVYGSALDRLLSDAALRARLTHEVGKTEITGVLSDDGRAALESLDGDFKERSLPSGLELGWTGSRRISVAAMVGLTAERVGGQLPLASWGAGTQRLAALEVAAKKQGDIPITLVDELERGLEPHRQRLLTQSLVKGPGQSFATTHSPVVLAAAVPSDMWYLDASGTIGRLSDTCVRHALVDAEAFLSKVTVVAEGATEVGFLGELLARSTGRDLGMLGIRVTDAGGNDPALALLEGLGDAGLRVGGIVDNEGTSAGRWEAVTQQLGSLVLQWREGCTESNVIRGVDGGDLEALVEDPEGEKTGERLRSVQERLRTSDKDWETLVAATDDLRGAVVQAATGEVPSWVEEADDAKRFKKHDQHWFKGLEGGRELAVKALRLGAWEKLRPQVWPLIETVCQLVGAEAADPGKTL